MISEEQKLLLLECAIEIAQIRSDVNAIENEIANGGKDPGLDLYKNALIELQEQFEEGLIEFFGSGWDIKSPKKLLDLPMEDLSSIPPFSRDEIWKQVSLKNERWKKKSTDSSNG